MKRLLAIVGPTGSGKSELGMVVAKRLSGEIVSADSRQIYKFLDIGTSKPTKEDQAEIPHYFIDTLEPEEDYSAGMYGREARARILEILKHHKQPILVGGAGLYIKAVIGGLFNGPEKDPEIRRQLEARLRDEGAVALLATLHKVDPKGAAHIDSTKPRRIIRALEVYYITGKPLSEFHREQSSEVPFVAVQFGIEWERRKLYERIDKRVEFMLSRGLVDEVRWLQRHGYGRHLNALNSVGYKEVYDHLEGKTGYDEMVELIKRNTRRFAKRQLTWFRADKRIEWMKMDESLSCDDLADNVVRRINAG